MRTMQIYCAYRLDLFQRAKRLKLCQYSCLLHLATPIGTEKELNKLMKSKYILLPSILTTSSTVFKQQLSWCKQVEVAHIDVIDGSFCHGKTILPAAYPTYEQAERLKYCEAHLMTTDPITYLEDLKKMGVLRVIVHVEAKFDLEEFCSRARQLDILIGFAVNPDTDLDSIKTYIARSAYIQIMGVEPGESNQKMRPNTDLAVKYVRALLPTSGIISVDGGVTLQNAKMLIDAGADYLVSHQQIFNGTNWSSNYFEILDTLGVGNVDQVT